MLGVRLEPELGQRLDAIAARTGRSKSYYVRKAIRELIEVCEDAAAVIAALEGDRRRFGRDSG